MKILLWVALTLASDISRYCYNKIPFTGYKFQMEIGGTTSYSLIYCNENKLLFKVSMPYLNGNFTIGNDTFTIMRSSTSILPNKLQGALLVNGEFLDYMLSDNMLKTWLEITHEFKRIVHIPILTTPQIDSKYHFPSLMRY